ncbi:udp-glycosyltransferase [Pseudozyma flocculosa PF-1]|uniref:Related to Ustilagic Acid glycosyl transferase n=1 Tax=Pseudozyma flocculosa TaxID=84751 RepID=A0A5C3EVW0_9BASI|nr:udp-glycosyltransferase [Pseudozyma flocculosa PF-1]EPQ31810.1 udp-glycosyltransferase [Pseudozyma flocculosa PF-1]SPO35299.1 related to Ustilagic Acid glycosyl transferase [Pseudozyma flocculosa]
MTKQEILMVSWPAIGHARPMLDFGLSLLSDYPSVELTFICSEHQIASLRKLDGRAGTHPRLHLRGIEVAYQTPTEGGGSEVEPEVILTMQAAHALSTQFPALYSSLPHPPSLVICNWMIQRVADVVRTSTPQTKLMAFFDNAATFVTRMLGPVDIGGYGGVQQLWLRHCEENPHVDRDDLQLKEKLLGRRSEGTFQIPGSGIDRMNDREMSPQAKDYLLKVPITPPLVEIQRLVELSDAILINTHESVEGNVLAYLRSVINKEIYAIGSVMFRSLFEVGKTVRAAAAKASSTIEAKNAGNGADADDDDVMQFLHSQPRGSVLYISFGTMFRPTPAQLVKMLEILVEEAPDLSFVWTLGSGKDLIASCPPDERQRVRDLQSKLLRSGRGRLVDWADQHAILQHPATGFFLSHGGWNSCQESLLAGKPLLVFPFFGDQLFDAYLLKSRGVAYHIQSSRFDSPEAFLESYRYALGLCGAGNEDGERLKRNAEAMLERILHERDEVVRESEKRQQAVWRSLFVDAGEERVMEAVGGERSIKA